MIPSQNYFCHDKDGEFSPEKIKELPSAVQAMGDPNQMMNQQVGGDIRRFLNHEAVTLLYQKMMMTGMVPQMVMMGIITYFFRCPPPPVSAFAALVISLVSCSCAVGSLLRRSRSPLHSASRP